jgi:hypothetical protein
MRKIKILYAFDKNKDLIKINNTIKNNEYFCIDCNNTLIQKKGKIKRWHFSHKGVNLNCSNESNSHKLAKEYIKENLNKIKIYNCCINNCQNCLELNNDYECKIEYPMDKYRIDIMVYNNNTKIAIEVFNKSKVSNEKIDYFIKKNMQLIEINCNDIITKVEKKENLFFKNVNNFNCCTEHMKIIQNTYQNFNHTSDFNYILKNIECNCNIKMLNICKCKTPLTELILGNKWCTICNKWTCRCLIKKSNCLNIKQNLVNHI